MGKSISFFELWKMVCDRVPEADELKVMSYLMNCVGMENGRSIAIDCAREIEKRMIDEGMI